MVSCNMIEYVVEYNVFQTNLSPSDHAPISLKLLAPGIDLDDLSYRAGLLGEYALMTHSCQNSRVKKPIRWSTIDNEAFVNNVCNANLEVDYNDVNKFADNVTEIFYECSVASQGHAEVIDVARDVSRWNMILQDQDDATVWREKFLAGKVPR